MTITRFARIAGLSCSLLMLSACTAFRTADNELDTASRQLATQNMALTADAAKVPGAAITPRGDFLIAGKPVAITPRQRQEVLAYRAQYVEVAQQGIAIGHEGVDAGRHAVVPMVFAALFGASDDAIEASMHKRLDGARKASEKLCTRLPQLMAAQRQLAADLPEFKPYATLTQKDVDECHDDVRDSFDVASTRNHDQ